MAKARFCKGLRRGSTKTETYSTLSTRKFGRIQIIKDRVTDVANPQSRTQMIQRVIFATVTKAAQVMASLVEISRENQPDRNYARQEFITENIAFIRSVADRRVGLNRHYLAAYAPKGNQQLIPNSYIVSKGSLVMPTVKDRDGQPFVLWDVKTSENKGSFGANTYQAIGSIGALPVGNYTRENIIATLLGLIPGDQLTFPQISGSESAQVMLDGENVVDKTLVTKFAAPRIVLKDDFGTETLEVTAQTTITAITNFIKGAIDEERSYMPIVENFLGGLGIEDTADDVIEIASSDAFADAMSVDTYAAVRAFGIILSRAVNGKWTYTNCQLTCIWDFIGVDSGIRYFGFTLDNAIDTYLPAAKTDANGNFLQRGGDSDIMPPQ